MRVVLVDPSQQVPYYGRALAGALAAGGADVTLATSPLIYYDPGPPPAGVALAEPFGRLLAHGIGATGADWWVRHGAARRLLRGLGYPAELAALVRHMRRTAPAVVHVQWSLVPHLDAWAVGALRGAGIGTVVTAHNALPHERRPWHAASYRRLYTAADRVIVHSNATRDRLLALGGVPPDRVRVIPIPADAERDAVDRRGARRALGLQDDLPVALFFGHIRPYKGLDDLLEAWPLVAQRLPGARLVVAGPVAGGTRHPRARSGSVDGSGPHGAVDLRPGFVAPPGVTSFFAAADVVVLPYRATDDSAVLATARGHGRAVVATAVGGLPEALAAGGGRTVPPGDRTALADALIAILGDPGARDRLEAEARAAAAAWTWRHAAAATREIYDELQHQRS